MTRWLPAEPATIDRLRCLEVALALPADQGLAGSTMAARVAASLRADPCSMVIAGPGALGGAPLRGSVGRRPLPAAGLRSAEG